MMTDDQKTRVKCPEPVCGRDFQPIASGKIRAHKRDGIMCPGGGQDPAGPTPGPFDEAAPMEGSPEFTYTDTAGNTRYTGALCRVCETPQAKTANGRIRTHQAKDAEGNCPGGSDFPAGDYPDIKGATDKDPRPTKAEALEAAEIYATGGNVPEDKERWAQDVLNREARYGVQPEAPTTDALSDFFGTGGDASAAPAAKTETPKRAPVTEDALAGFFGTGGSDAPAIAPAAKTETPKRAPVTEDALAGFFGTGGGGTPAANWNGKAPQPATPKAPEPKPEATAESSHMDQMAAFLAAAPGKDADSSRYGRWGKYKMVHPATGKADTLFTRATTMAKDISSTFALNQWKQRKAAEGYGLRPELLTAILALDPEKKGNKEAINALVEEAEQAAGSKVGAELGTALHALTELVDAGDPGEIPDVFKDDIRIYLEMLSDAGLEPVPYLTETTTCVLQYSTAGTMDRVFRVTKRLILEIPGKRVVLEPGDYIIGDLKTAKGLKYAWGEIAIQLAIYAQGLNMNGVYDWDARTWSKPHTLEDVNVPLQVRTDVAVVVHLPADHARAESAPALYGLDIDMGWAALGLVDQVRKWRSVKTLAGAVSVSGLPEEEFQAPGVPAVTASAAPVAQATAPKKVRHLSVVPTPVVDWDAKFRAVTSKAGAADAWNEAKAAGLSDERLAELVKVAQDALNAPKAEAPAPPPAAPGPVASPEPPASVDWESRFREVTTKAEATALWSEANGQVTPDELKRLTAIGMDALKRMASALPVQPTAGQDWAGRFASATSKAEAGALWAQAKDVLDKSVLDALVKDTLERLTRSAVNSSTA